MDYLKNCAGRIVREMATVTEYDVNLMDEKGLIIASTDPRRIGNIHAGALKILEEGLDELIIQEADEETGVREGANYPILLGRTIVGVIGITGDWEDTSRLGKMAQKMTQLLLTEISAKEQKNFLKGLLYEYITEWIRNENTIFSKGFINQGKQLGIDITIPRRFMLVNVQVDDNPSDFVKESWSREQIEEKIENFIRRADPLCVFMSTETVILVGVSNCSDRAMQSLAEGILSAAKKSETAHLSIGIDEKCRTYLKASESFHEAEKALRCSLLQQDGSICFYKDVNLELVLDEISVDAKSKYLHKLFQGYKQEEIDEALHLVDVLYRNDGSLQAASELLHMHKNTLQYKLRKIQERTGYDPRSLRSASLFRIAVLFTTILRDDYDASQI